MASSTFSQEVEPSKSQTLTQQVSFKKTATIFANLMPPITAAIIPSVFSTDSFTLTHSFQ